MKALAIILLIIPFWVTNGLAQEKDIAALLNNSETRSEIFNKILNDHQLMMDFMDAMQKSDHAMMMMKENPMMTGNQTMGDMQMNSEHQMMGTMHDNSEMMHQMMSMMKENPDMMQKMMGNMMDLCEKDSTQCENMAKVMSEHPYLMMMGMQKAKDGQMESNSGARMNMMKPEGSGIMQEHSEHH